LELFPQLFAVVFVLAVLVLAARWLARRGHAAPLGWNKAPKDPSLKLERVDRLALTPQHSIHVVRFGGRLLLVSCQPGGVSLLAETPQDRAVQSQGAGS